MIYREHQSRGRNSRGELTRGSGEIRISFNGVEAEDVKIRAHQMLAELESMGYQVKIDRLPSMIREVIREKRSCDALSEKTAHD